MAPEHGAPNHELTEENAERRIASERRQIPVHPFDPFGDDVDVPDLLERAHQIRSTNDDSDQSAHHDDALEKVGPNDRFETALLK